MGKKPIRRTTAPMTEDYMNWLADQTEARRQAAETVARTIKGARRQLKMTQSELALRIGSTQPSISRLERGRLNDVGIQMIQRIGSALGLETVLTFQGRGQEHGQD